MRSISRHLTRSLIAGTVALLPIGGLVLTVVWMESTISGSWLAERRFYFPGLGIVATFAIIYVIGLVVSTFLGRWIWSRIDRLLDQVPALGQLYQTLKQILGYGEGQDAIFHSVVLVPSRETPGEELGLVTNTLEHDGVSKIAVFIPGAPNPTAGRLLLIESKDVRPIDLPVSEALKSMVTLGKVSPVGDPGGSE